MTLNLHTDWFNGSYIKDRNYVIKMIEAPLLAQNKPEGQQFLRPHYEGVSVAIGYGLDLLVNTTNTIDQYLSIVGLSLTSKDKIIIDEIKAIKKNKSLSDSQKDYQIITKVSQFDIDLGNESNANSVLNQMMTLQYEPRLNQIINGMPESKERAALVSLVYHSLKNITDDFISAYNAGDRAEAWYQLRYNTRFLDNLKIRDGIAKRRFYAADLFSLYSPTADGHYTAISTEDAKGAYRMYTRHKQDIQKYNRIVPVATIVTNANHDFKVSFVQSLSDWLLPARTYLVNLYAPEHRFGFAITGDILVGEDQPINYTNLRPTDDDIISGTDKNDLIFGEAGKDILWGGSGRDVLYGGMDDDVLKGGLGDDVLDGGPGRDTYVWKSGDGNDRIIEQHDPALPVGAQKPGTVVYEDANRRWITLSGGLQDNNSNVYKSADQRITYEINGTTLRVSFQGKAGSITIENFQNGDYGIRLQTRPQTSLLDLFRLAGTALLDHLIGTAAAEEIQTFQGNDQVEGKEGNDYIEGNEGNDTLQGGAGHDVLDGGEGDDLLFGSEGYDPAGYTADGTPILEGHVVSSEEDDKIDGGAGNDTIWGDGGNDVLHGGDGADLVAGGEGDDVVHGDAGDDTLWGVEGHDELYGGLGQDHLWGDDIYAQKLINGQTVYAGNDLLDGGEDHDSLHGMFGDDVLLGGEGDDALEGDYIPDAPERTRAGTDFLDGGAGNDIVLGDGDDDTLFGGTGNDVLWGDTGGKLSGQDGNDYLDGGEGDDQLRGEGGVDVLLGEDGNDELHGGADDDTLWGGTGNDLLWGDNAATATGQDGNDFLDGGDGDDQLVGEGGDDALFGGTGDDKLFGQAGQDSLYGGDDNDQLWGESGQDSLYGGNGQDSLAGGDEDDLLLGEADADSLYGDAGNDSLYGDEGNDQLVGGSGNDTLDGGNGDDILVGNSDNDTLFGGNGQDFLYGGDSDSDLTADGDDLLDGGEGNDQLVGRGGNDLLYGGEGNDTLWGGSGQDILHGDAGADILHGDAADDTLFGDDGDDQLRGDDGNDTLWGGAGDDLLSELAGDDLLYGEEGNDQLAGGVGDDVLDGGVGNDWLSGDAGNDILQGGDGKDALYGQAGNDTFDGGSGETDWLFGGAGSDTYLFGRTSESDVIIEQATTPGSPDVDIIRLADDVTPEVVSLYRHGRDLILVLDNSPTQLVVQDFFIDSYLWDDDPLRDYNKIEHIVFGDGTSWDRVDIKARVIDGSPSLVVGSVANEELFVDDPLDIVDPNATQGINTLSSNVSYTLPDGVENFTLTGVLNVNATGNSLDNVLIGNSSNNILDGKEGSDTLMGGAGNDHYRIDSNDTVIEAPGGGIDWVEAADALSAYTLPDEVENGSFEGNHFAYTPWLIGNDLDNTLIGREIDSTYIDGGAGADTMIGGTNSDTYVVDNIGDTIIDAAIGAGTDLVRSSISYTLGDTLEHLTLVGSEAIQGTGNDRNNQLDGTENSAANVLTGGLGDDTYRLGSGDTVVEYFEEGIDSVEIVEGAVGTYTLEMFPEVENLQLGAALNASNLTGNAVDNILQGNDAANTLMGEAGNDLLYGKRGNDTLNGGEGDDRLFGASGNDTYAGGAGNDTFTDSVSASDAEASHDVYRFGRGDGQDVVSDSDSRTTMIDTLQFAADILPGDIILARNQYDLIVGIRDTSDQITIQNYFLSAAYQIEQFQFADGTIWNKTALDAWLATNNANVPTVGADTLTGSVASDTLAALGGDDTVAGGESDDTLDGGTGNDSLFGNAGNDVLYGQEGTDWLAGNVGNDLLDGGVGADTMDGGTGDDTYLVDNAADRVMETVDAGTDTVYSSVTYALTPGSHIENLVLTGTAAINGNGNEFANVLTGNAAQNRLWGGAGSDTMLGGKGDDTYVVDNSGDSVIENLNEGTDTVESSITYTLGAHVENLTLLATAAPIHGTGNTLDNVLKGNGVANTLTGGAGNDTLDGGAGADTLLGGTGDDLYVIDQSGDSVTENANEGVDTVRSAITYTLGANVEHLTLIGSAAINGTGNTLANVLLGNSGKNTLTGNAGNDTLDGAGGNDTLKGGTGNDVYRFGSGGGNDTISENDSTSGNRDRTDITLDPLRLIFSRPTGSSNLLVTLQGTSDTLTIQSWYSGTKYQTEVFQASDGRTLLNTQVAQLIQAMATFSANHGGMSWAQAIQERPDEVQAVLAAYWQPAS